MGSEMCIRDSPSSEIENSQGIENGTVGLILEQEKDLIKVLWQVPADKNAITHVYPHWLSMDKTEAIKLKRASKMQVPTMARSEPVRTVKVVTSLTEAPFEGSLDANDHDAMSACDGGLKSVTRGMESMLLRYRDSSKCCKSCSDTIKLTLKHFQRCEEKRRSCTSAKFHVIRNLGETSKSSAPLSAEATVKETMTLSLIHI